MDRKADLLQRIRRALLRPFIPEMFQIEGQLELLARKQKSQQDTLTRIFDDCDTTTKIIRELQELEFQNHNNLHAIANYILQSKIGGNIDSGERYF